MTELVEEKHYEEPMIEYEYDYVLGWYNVIKNFARGEFRDAIHSASRLFRNFGVKDPMKYWVKAQLLFDEYRRPSTIYKRIELNKLLVPKSRSNWRRIDSLKNGLMMEHHAFKVLFRGLEELKDIFEEYYGDDIWRLAPPGFIDDLTILQAGFSGNPGGYPTELYDACLTTAMAMVLGYQEDVPPLVKMALWIHYYMSMSREAKLFPRRYIIKYLHIKEKFDKIYYEFFKELQPYKQRIREIEEISIRYRFSPLWIMMVNKDPYRLHVPFFRIPRSVWASGTIPHKGLVMLEPVKNFDLFPVGNRAMLNAIYGITGSGKSSLANSLAIARLDHGGFGFRAEIDIDERMQSQIMAVPLSKDHPAYKWVVEEEKLKPRGLIVKKENMKPNEIEKELRDPDLISLVIIKKDSDLKYVYPPLKFDRIVYVEDPRAFKIDFSILAKPGRLVCMRFVEDHLTRNAFRCVIKSFMEWRRTNKRIKAFFQIDEGMLGAAAMPSMIYGASSVRSAEEVAVLSRGARGLGLAVDINTQRASWLVAGARSQMSNVFTGHVGEKKDLDAILSRIPYGADKVTIESVLQHSEISQDNTYKWFLWFDYSRGTIEMIRAVFPPVGAEITTYDKEDYFKPYELLTDSWDYVPVLIDDNGYGTKENPLPVYEPYLTEKEREKYIRKMKKEKTLHEESYASDIINEL